MKTVSAITIGAIIWVLGVSAYSLSFYLPMMENAEQQANLVLFVTVMPLVWFGSKIYYRKDQKTHGYWVGQAFLLTAATLDALITVPFLVVPNGGNHYEFFTDLGFWIIAIEFLAVATLYWYAKVYPKTSTYHKHSKS